MMKVAALFFLFACTAMAFLMKRTPLPVYGVATRETIAVAVYGEGVARPGLYHVQSDSSLVHVIVAAGAPSGTRYTIELINSQSRTPYLREISFDRSKRPIVEPVALLDGDEVVFRSVPNKSAERTLTIRPFQHMTAAYELRPQSG